MAAGMRAATPSQPHGLHMDLFAWLAFGCYLLAFFIVSLFAAAYLKRSDFMPYHGQAVGVPWAEIEPRMQVLLMALIRVVGAGWIALAGAGVMLAWLIFFGGHFALPQLLAFQLFCLVATLPPVWSLRVCEDAPVHVHRCPLAPQWCCCPSLDSYWPCCRYRGEFPFSPLPHEAPR